MGSAGVFLVGTQVQLVLPDLLFREPIRRGMMEAGQLDHGADVRLDGPVGVSTELQEK